LLTIIAHCKQIRDKIIYSVKSIAHPLTC
jgi:hypothetical protein